MVDFIKNRLQVFVSSTFTDLRQERQAAVEAILSAGHIPAGMELFAAGDESQMEAIKQWIDESDVFLLILGGRYGSIDLKSGKSYIHLEYEHALSKGKPLFACVIADAALQNASTKYDSSENAKQLDEFRNFVKSKLVEFWEDPKDIKIAIHKKLGELARRKDLVGWVRANQEAALSDELARQNRKNVELRMQLAAYTAKLTISAKVEGEPPSQFIQLVAADGKIKLHRVDYMTTEESTMAYDDVSVEEGAIKYPVNRDLLVKVWNTHRPNRNAYDHSGPAKIGLTVSAKSKSYHLILPVQMSQMYKNTAQGTTVYIQVTGSKMFFDL